MQTRELSWATKSTTNHTIPVWPIGCGHSSAVGASTGWQWWATKIKALIAKITSESLRISIVAYCMLS